MAVIRLKMSGIDNKNSTRLKSSVIYKLKVRQVTIDKILSHRFHQSIKDI